MDIEKLNQVAAHLLDLMVNRDEPTDLLPLADSVNIISKVTERVSRVAASDSMASELLKLFKSPAKE